MRANPFAGQNTLTDYLNRLSTRKLEAACRKAGLAVARKEAIPFSANRAPSSADCPLSLRIGPVLFSRRIRPWRRLVVPLLRSDLRELDVCGPWRFLLEAAPNVSS